MTEGSVWRHIVRFALPVFWGNLFQQLYNVVDSLVVGNFLGSDALAAVGSSSHGLLRRTAEAGSREILTVAAQDEFVTPSHQFVPEAI